MIYGVSGDVMTTALSCDKPQYVMAARRGIRPIHVRPHQRSEHCALNPRHKLP
jgi:hypothetical protein